jgi:hypothetical protein
LPLATVSVFIFFLLSLRLPDSVALQELLLVFQLIDSSLLTEAGLLQVLVEPVRQNGKNSSICSVPFRLCARLSGLHSNASVPHLRSFRIRSFSCQLHSQSPGVLQRPLE